MTTATKWNMIMAQIRVLKDKIYMILEIDNLELLRNEEFIDSYIKSQCAEHEENENGGIYIMFNITEYDIEFNESVLSDLQEIGYIIESPQGEIE